MKVIQAPHMGELYGTKVFLAGGISGCRNWQKETIDALDKYFNLLGTGKNIAIINPRQDNFDPDAPIDEIIKQIKWEHYMLEKSDIVAFFFDNSDSVQPISLYELGKWTSKKSNIITVVDGYKRALDVEVQCYLDGLYVGQVDQDKAAEKHAKAIITAIKVFEEEKI